MVTANLNHERRPPSAIADDDETDDRHIQTRLDRLYLENPSYNRLTSHQQYSYSQRALSPSSSRDMFASANTVPVYRHGRKFYVSIEEYERIRADERRQRRTALQKTQNLPISKSHSIHNRGSATSLYNPIHRSTSQSHEYRYGVLRAPHLPANSTVINNNFSRLDITRQSRPLYRYSDDRDDLSSMTPAAPLRLPTTTTNNNNITITNSTVRSNSSDKVLDLRKTPEPSSLSYNTYLPDDYELKRSISAESVQTPVTQPQTLPRRTIPPSTIKSTSDFSMSTAAPTSYSIPSTDQTYSQSNASKLTSYFSRLPSSSLHSPNIPIKSSCDTNIQESEPTYSVVNSTTRRPNTSSTALLTRTSTHNSNSNEYYFRDTNSGSFSDENSSSPSIVISRQNPDNYRSRRAQLVVETDDDYGQQQQGDTWSRPTVRSHSSDGLTEKKRVRFADMEGYTLETVPDVEPQRSPVSNRLIIKRSYGQPTNYYQEPVQSYHSSLYRTTARVGGIGGKLATDV